MHSKKKLGSFSFMFAAQQWPFWTALALESYSNGLRCTCSAGTGKKWHWKGYQYPINLPPTSHTPPLPKKLSASLGIRFTAHCTIHCPVQRVNRNCFRITLLQSVRFRTVPYAAQYGNVEIGVTHALRSTLSVQALGTLVVFRGCGFCVIRKNI